MNLQSIRLSHPIEVSGHTVHSASVGKPIGTWSNGPLVESIGYSGGLVTVLIGGVEYVTSSVFSGVAAPRPVSQHSPRPVSQQGGKKRKIQ